MADGRLIFDTSINTSGFESDLRGLDQTVNSTGFSVGKGVKSLLGADIIRKAAEAVIEFGKDSIEAGSSIQEIQNVIDTTFGDNASEINAWAKTAEDSYGVAETAALRYAGQFGTLLKTAGMADELTLQATKDLVGLGGDFASYWDNDIEVSLSKILSALKGETEAINDYGVDVRIAALSAFKGFEMTGASQLDQLTAIYEKLMADTAYVQGDFVKTAESFANQTRILKTNIQQLQAQIGGVFLPVATSVVTSLNQIFDPDTELTVVDKLQTVSDSLETFNADAAEAAAHFETVEATIEGRAKLAETYLSTLEGLEGKEIKTDEDVSAINNAIAALNTLYPELQLYFDPATGKINENTQAIRDNIDALQTLAVQNLFTEQQQENANRYAQALDNLAMAEIALEEAKAPVATLEEQIQGINGLMSQLEESNFQSVDAYFGQFAELINGFDQFFQQNLDGSWSAVEGMMPDIGMITNSAANTLSALNIQREQLTQGVTEAQTAVDSYNQAISEINAEQAEIAAKQEKVKQLMQTGGQEAASAEAQGISDNAGEVASAIDIMNQDAATIDTSIYYNAGRKAAHQYAMGLKSVTMPTLSAGGTSGGVTIDGKHATGLNWVPYDNYVASLHVGEAVLSAADARRWRSSESAASASTDLPSSAYAKPAAKTVINLDGHRIAEIQGQNNSAQLAWQNTRSAKGVGSK